MKLSFILPQCYAEKVINRYIGSMPNNSCDEQPLTKHLCKGKNFVQVDLKYASYPTRSVSICQEAFDRILNGNCLEKQHIKDNPTMLMPYSEYKLSNQIPQSCSEGGLYIEHKGEKYLVRCQEHTEFLENYKEDLANDSKHKVSECNI